MSRIGSPRTWNAVARARLAVPAAATAALCFSAGGFFPGATAVAAIAALVALLLRITLARRPWEGWSAGLSVGAGALALFAVWTLVSSHWSGAPGRALLEFDRTLLYLAAFVVSGLFAARAGDLAVVLRWTAAAACGVCLAALATRLAPGTFPTDTTPSHTRLESRSRTGTASAPSPPSAWCSRSTSRRRSASRASRACSPRRASRPSPSASTSRSRAAAASRRRSASRSTSSSATRAGSCRPSSRSSRRPPSRSSARSTPICSPARASSSPWPPRSAATC